MSTRIPTNLTTEQEANRILEPEYCFTNQALLPVGFGVIKENVVERIVYMPLAGYTQIATITGTTEKYEEEMRRTIRVNNPKNLRQNILRALYEDARINHPNTPSLPYYPTSSLPCYPLEERSSKVRLELVPEHDNCYDPNAIIVALHWQAATYPVGYVPRIINKYIKDNLDRIQIGKVYDLTYSTNYKKENIYQMIMAFPYTARPYQFNSVGRFRRLLEL